MASCQACMFVMQLEIYSYSKFITQVAFQQRLMNIIHETQENRPLVLLAKLVNHKSSSTKGYQLAIVILNFALSNHYLSAFLDYFPFTP